MDTKGSTKVLIISLLTPNCSTAMRKATREHVFCNGCTQLGIEQCSYNESFTRRNMKTCYKADLLKQRQNVIALWTRCKEKNTFLQHWENKNGRRVSTGVSYIHYQCQLHSKLHAFQHQTMLCAHEQTSAEIKEDSVCTVHNVSRRPLDLSLRQCLSRHHGCCQPLVASDAQ